MNNINEYDEAVDQYFALALSKNQTCAADIQL